MKVVKSEMEKITLNELFSQKLRAVNLKKHISTVHERRKGFLERIGRSDLAQIGCILRKPPLLGDVFEMAIRLVENNSSLNTDLNWRFEVRKMVSKYKPLMRLIEFFDVFNPSIDTWVMVEKRLSKISPDDVDKINKTGGQILRWILMYLPLIAALKEFKSIQSLLGGDVEWDPTDLTRVESLALIPSDIDTHISSLTTTHSSLTAILSTKHDEKTIHIQSSTLNIQKLNKKELQEIRSFQRPRPDLLSSVLLANSLFLNNPNFFNTGNWLDLKRWGRNGAGTSLIGFRPWAWDTLSVWDADAVPDSTWKFIETELFTLFVPKTEREMKEREKYDWKYKYQTERMGRMSTFGEGLIGWVWGQVRAWKVECEIRPVRDKLWVCEREMNVLKELKKRREMVGKKIPP